MRERSPARRPVMSDRAPAGLVGERAAGRSAAVRRVVEEMAPVEVPLTDVERETRERQRARGGDVE